MPPREPTVLSNEDMCRLIKEKILPPSHYAHADLVQEFTEKYLTPQTFPKKERSAMSIMEHEFRVRLDSFPISAGCIVPGTVFVMPQGEPDAGLVWAAITVERITKKQVISYDPSTGKPRETSIEFVSVYAVGNHPSKEARLRLVNTEQTFEFPAETHIRLVGLDPEAAAGDVENALADFGQAGKSY